MVFYKFTNYSYGIFHHGQIIMFLPPEVGALVIHLVSIFIIQANKLYSRAIKIIHIILIKWKYRY